MSELQVTNPMTRRKFVKGVSAVAGSSLALGGAVKAQDTGSDRKIRIGVVGGRFGSSFQWHEHPNCELVAVSDLRPERMENLVKTYRCDRTFESLEKMVLADDVEAIALFTEAPNHVPHSELVLNHGKHVISAVPAALTLEECESLVATVEKTGLTYMMAETSYYQQSTISARKFFEEGKFGTIYYTESQYLHPGLEDLWFENGDWTWRHGLPPMLYPTHCTAHLVGVTGERLTEVTCIGWGDDNKPLKGNPYDNPFWNETAMFKTDEEHAFRVAVHWKGAVRGGERAEWNGDKMSFYFRHPNGLGPLTVTVGDLTELDTGGFKRAANTLEPYEQPEWWKTDMLPEPLRHNSGHEGSHTFLTHEFIDALVHERRPAIDVYEAVAYTAPGIVAHQSALKGGEQMKIPDFGKAKA
jgi:predicted dehydrogenase